MRGYGYEPLFMRRAEDDPSDVHRRFAATLDEALDRMQEIQRAARVERGRHAADLADDRVALPEGMDRPDEVDGLPMEGTWRSHQVPMTDVRTNAGHLQTTRRLAAQLQPGRVVRRRRKA